MAPDPAVAVSSSGGSSGAEGVGFPPLRASGKWTRSSLRVQPGEPRFACFL
jgi:hypothetical protein